MKSTAEAPATVIDESFNSAKIRNRIATGNLTCHTRRLNALRAVVTSLSQPLLKRAHLYEINSGTWVSHMKARFTTSRGALSSVVTHAKASAFFVVFLARLFGGGEDSPWVLSADLSTPWPALILLCKSCLHSVYKWKQLLNYSYMNIIIIVYLK